MDYYSSSKEVTYSIEHTFCHKEDAVAVMVVRDDERLRISFEDREAVVLDATEELGPVRKFLQDPDPAVLGPGLGGEVAVVEHEGAAPFLSFRLFFAPGIVFSCLPSLLSVLLLAALQAAGAIRTIIQSRNEIN